MYQKNLSYISGVTDGYYFAGYGFSLTGALTRVYS